MSTGDDEARVADWVRDLRFDDLPGPVVRQAQRCLLDTAGVAAAGSTTPMSRLAREHAVEYYATTGRGVRILLDGRSASPVGAAIAGAATIDSLDGHDGHDLTKGHAGAAVLPAALAFTEFEADDASGAELLTRLVLGYEIGLRAGIALHATAADYHTSGAWNALGCAAIGARALRLDPDRTLEALGIAEYHAPRSPMLRCIDNPTMVKDGSGWGAGAGVEAALLAARGFTGAPAGPLTAYATRSVWSDLGVRWRITEQYVKPYPVCRWAHPAIQAAITLAEDHHVHAEDVRTVEVRTFHEATRLATAAPTNTEQAQYSLPFALALALTYRDVRPEHLAGAALTNPETRRLAAGVVLREDPELTRGFPANRQATVRLTLTDGHVLTSPLTTARGGPDRPLSDSELHHKFVGYSTPVLGDERATMIARLVTDLPTAGDCTPMLTCLLTPPPHTPRR
ncbi:MmgE/PrpD family protein [Actinophytocola sp.]|uniref:MmgE/PrpD family protein n=1 Tax=Actinophytocola sp. TaxID=1872138 RepID=UPI003D6A8C3F